MTRNKLLEKVEEIRREQPTYRLGGDGSDGTCDCIGLIIGAIRRAGGKWTGTHGSNYTARNELAYLLAIGTADDLNVGEVVLKARTATADGYDLPSRYAKDPDKRDYYHIGVVMSTDPLRIVHCTTGGGANGMAEDTRVGQWTHRGWLSKVSQEGDTPMVDMQTATVVAESGKTVNLRQTPGGALVARVPVGAEVAVSTSQNGWSRIAYGQTVGWMMDDYLDFGDAASDGSPLEQRVTELTRTVADLLNRVARLEGGESNG